MSRRRRAAGFANLAVLAAVLAGAIVDGYGSSVANSYGELRRVLVTRSALARGKQLDPATLPEALEVRRVPARFVPPGALRAPAEAFGTRAGGRPARRLLPGDLGAAPAAARRRARRG